MSPSDRELVIEKTSNYVWFLVASRLPPKLCISGAILVEAFEPVCENLMISAARLQASRLIVMLFGSRQRMFMMLRTCFGSSVAMVVAAQSRKRCTHRCFPKAARVCFATRRGITLYVSGVPVWEIQTASQSRRCSTPPSREQDRSVVIEVSIEVSDLGSRALVSIGLPPFTSRPLKCRR